MEDQESAEQSAAAAGYRFRPDWLALTQEEPIDPERTIVDPHFHFFEESDSFPYYTLSDLQLDARQHNTQQAVFIQCQERFRTSGPEHLRPVGETEWMDSRAKEASEAGSGSVQIGGIVGDARLSLGRKVRETLDAHLEASALFRGIRDIGVWDASPEIDSMDGVTGPDLYGEPAFREGFSELNRLGLSFDAHQYHTQLSSVAGLARAFPDTTIILDHLGSPLAEGPYKGKREEVYLEWRRGMADIADCPNIVVKLGGLAMPWCRFEWEHEARPPTSDQFVEVYARYYHYAIETFGPDRCMFESNFPVDRLSLSYTVLWNAFKKLAATYSDDEQDGLLRGTATRVYRLNPLD